MTARRAISGDSHTMEPGDLWAERLDKPFRDDAPRVVDNENGVGSAFVIPGLGRQQISGAWALGKNDKDLTEHLLKSTMKDARPGGWDPAARLEDQDADGVEAEVLYSTLGLRLYPMDYPELQHACFQVYYDWLSEFCSYAPNRLHGVAMISLWDVERGAQELRRAADLGLKGGMIWASPPLSRPYFHRMYGPALGDSPRAFPAALAAHRLRHGPREQHTPTRHGSRAGRSVEIHEPDPGDTALPRRHRPRRRPRNASRGSRSSAPSARRAGFPTSCSAWTTPTTSSPPRSAIP